MSTEQPEAPAANRPRELTTAAAITAVEGIVLAAWGVSMLVAGLAGDEPGTGVMGGLTVLVLALIPLAASYGLWRLRRWSRGPALVVQIFALPVAWTLLTADGATAALGGALALSAIAGPVLLLRPVTTTALGITPPRPGPGP